MSEYQYYEWQTIDRPLTEKQRAEVDRLSSHMDVVTSTQAVVTYSFGDFKHDPETVLLKYFDAFLYLSSWGGMQLMFRFSKGSIDVEAINAYCLEDRITLKMSEPYYILEISLGEEEGGDAWIEGQGLLGQLTPLREQIIQGDYRALYLAWLKAIPLGDDWYDEDDEWDGDEDDYEEEGEYEAQDEEMDQAEPPVPAGLQELTAGLKAFIEIFDIDPHLVKAAAQASPALNPVPDEALQNALSRLPRQECEDYLRRLLMNEPQLSSALRKRLTELAGIETGGFSQPRRLFKDLLQSAEQVRKEADRKAKEAAKRKRIKELMELLEREEATWRWIVSLIEQKQGRPYDEAVGLLVDLRDLAIYQNRLPEFERRYTEIRDRYSKSRSVMDRFIKAGLS